MKNKDKTQKRKLKSESPLYDPERRDEERVFKLTRRSRWYFVLLGATLVFTQLLRAKASHIFFLFVFFLPFAMALYTLIARSVLRIYMISESCEAKKCEDFLYEFRVLNESVLPYPFVEAVMTLPQKNSVRCRERVVKLSMPPSASYSVKNKVKFRFRGNYEIGVRCFYVYDFLKLFRLRIDVDNTINVTVLPRKLFLSNSDAQSPSDEASRIIKTPLAIDKIEVSDIRDYRPGDPLKSIHWKLSSKSEDFIIRDFDTGSAKAVCVFCDFSAKYPEEPVKKADGDNCACTVVKKSRKQLKKEKAARDAERIRSESEKNAEDDPDIASISDEELERINADAKKKAKFSSRGKKTVKAGKDKVSAFEVKLEESVPLILDKKTSADPEELASPEFYEDMNEYCADGAVELAISAVLDELDRGNETCLLWFDKRSPIGIYAFTLKEAGDLDLIFRLFATAPVCDRGKDVATLSEYISKNQSAKQVFVTGSASGENIASFCRMTTAGDAGEFGSCEVLLYSPDERFLNTNEREVYLSNCRDQLGMNGIKLTVGKLPEYTDKEADNDV